jgi:RNA polymerase primary sigma factor
VSSVQHRQSRAVGNVTIMATLSKEEETALLHDIEKGRRASDALANIDVSSDDDVNTLRLLVRSGRRAEEHLLSSTCAIVKKRVNELGLPFDHDELEAAGLEGLVNALRRFDSSRGLRFSTYANYWIEKMVLAAVSNRVPYPDADLRLVIRFRKLQRSAGDKSLHANEVARELSTDRKNAARIMQISEHIASGMDDVNSPNHPMVEQFDGGEWREAEWVIDALREALGDDFRDFWMLVGRVMSLDELGKEHGISKQAMAKRKLKWQKKVEHSPHADRLLTWLREQ